MTTISIGDIVQSAFTAETHHGHAMQTRENRGLFKSITDRLRTEYDREAFTLEEVGTPLYEAVGRDARKLLHDALSDGDPVRMDVSRSPSPRLADALPPVPVPVPTFDGMLEPGDVGTLRLALVALGVAVDGAKQASDIGHADAQAKAQADLLRRMDTIKKILSNVRADTTGMLTDAGHAPDPAPRLSGTEGTRGAARAVHPLTLAAVLRQAARLKWQATRQLTQLGHAQTTWAQAQAGPAGPAAPTPPDATMTDASRPATPPALSASGSEACGEAADPVLARFLARVPSTLSAHATPSAQTSTSDALAFVPRAVRLAPRGTRPSVSRGSWT